MVKKITVLTLAFMLVFCNLAFAVSLIDFQPGEEVPDQNINIIANKNGTLDYLTYMISSTGATSGIRYRTSAITVTIGGRTATIDISSLVGTAPGGQSIYSQIIVTKEDVIKSLGMQYLNDILNANPEDVTIGANIQIYNAGNGKVLATITNRDDVASIAGNIGFGQKDISDMKSRWQSNSGILPPPPPPPPEHPVTPGLRPSVLIDDNDPRYNPTHSTPSTKSVNEMYR